MFVKLQTLTLGKVTKKIVLFAVHLVRSVMRLMHLFERELRSRRTYLISKRLEINERLNA